MARKKRNGSRRTREPNPGIALAIQIVGGQSELARTMGVEQPAVHHWLYVSCPPSRAKEIEDKLKGKVTRMEICPEVFG